MKKGGSNRKGHAFENMIAKRLSLWWTDDERDDVFIRSDSSGARATARSKVGKKQFGQYGDLQAADPIGQPLMDLCVIECKDGYAGHSIADLLDKLPRHKPKYEEFIEQAEASMEAADGEYWILIARRRGRQIMVYMPVGLWDTIVDDFRSNLEGVSHIHLTVYDPDLDFVGLAFNDFLKHMPPECIP